VLAVDLLVTAMVDGLAFALPDDIQTLFWRVDIETNMLLLSALLIAPVVEELLFRAGLRNATYLAFFGPALVALFAGSPAVALAMWAAAMACLLVWRRQLARAGGRVKMARHFSRRYRLWFWVYAGAFALLHTSNFTPTTGQYLWLPLLVLPQFLMGAGFGYVRIRNGLAGAMALHFTHNLMAVGLYLVGVRY
jgi:hypothetical protein